ncbi:MAG: hypothetical protein EXQ55_05695 [Acidobacteria bacterium]|nr:hypothetical protein [Acidobacteriota bacterium]
MLKLAAGVVGSMLLSTVLMAQGAPWVPYNEPGVGKSFSILFPPLGMIPAVERLKPTTLQGTIVEINCFKKMGAATVTSPEQIACAKAAVASKTGIVGILSDMDGVFKLVGPITASYYAKLVPVMGRNVNMPGVEIMLSNNFDYRAYEGRSFTPAK